MNIVITATGKCQTVNYIKVDIFNDVEKAREYINGVNTGYKKHWINAEIIEPGKDYETDYMIPEK